ncbi:MAG: hypothetical protein QNK35_07360, partial [Bacteroides sp.]|nr:hypothetical protein [Bacteroides sp.]
KTIIVDGEVKPLIEKNIIPSLDQPADMVWMALLMAALGIGVIVLLELILSKSKANTTEH